MVGGHCNLPTAAIKPGPQPSRTVSGHRALPACEARRVCAGDSSGGRLSGGAQI